MNRRDFIKSTIVGSAALALPAVSAREAITPKTVGQLRTSIESLFHVLGHSTRAWEQVGNCVVVHSAFCVGVAECALDLDDFHEAEANRYGWNAETEEQAVAVLWEEVLGIRGQGNDKMLWRVLPSFSNGKIRFRASFFS